MSFYRSVLAAVAAIAIASPVFADDASTATQGSTEATPAAQSSDSSNAAAQSAAPAANQDQASASSTEEKVNLNKATAKDLMKLKGMNASKARAIVAYRKQHGDFKSTDELSNVKGFKKMNPDMMKEITEQLSVE